MNRGFLVALVHLGLVMCVVAKYQFDRARLPRAWATVAPLDPELPLRGRYLRLRLQVEYSAREAGREYVPCRLTSKGGLLSASPDPESRITISHAPSGWYLSSPVAFFVPERWNATILAAGAQQLWAQVTVVPGEAPRPLKLGIKRGREFITIR